MISYMISYTKHIIDFISCHIWYHTWYHDIYTKFSCLAAANPPPAQRADASDDDHEPGRPMDFGEDSAEERDFADQGPLTDMPVDLEEDAKNRPRCSLALFLVVSRTAWSYSRPTPTIRIQWNRLDGWRIGVVCAPSTLLQLYLVPDTGQAPRGQCTAVRTRRCPWCISARLSPLTWPRIVSYSELECPCCMNWPATSACPASTSAQWPMCWGEPRSFRASSAATVTPAASQRGRSEGGWRRRQIGLNTIWYHMSYHSQYHIWYNRYHMNYDYY